jgi:hypothetical protein
LIIVIDTGLSAALAAHMLRAIRTRTEKPLAIVSGTGNRDQGADLGGLAAYLTVRREPP